MKAGGLVPDELILRLISNELNQRGWLFSGNSKANVMTLCSSGIAAEGQPVENEAEVATFLSSPAHARNDYTPPQASEDPSASFLLDGFPRTAAQADRLDEIVPINLAVSIKTPLEVMQ